jgi:hypothetical protein
VSVNQHTPELVAQYIWTSGRVIQVNAFSHISSNHGVIRVFFFCSSFEMPNRTTTACANFCANSKFHWSSFRLIEQLKQKFPVTFWHWSILTTAIMDIELLESATPPFIERSRRCKICPTTKAVSSQRSKDSAEIQGASRTPDSATFYPPINSLSAPSKSIPIAKSLKRTASELRLMEDEAMADFRDYRMYTRITNGINSGDSTEAVNNIIRTRPLPIRQISSSYQEDSIKYFIPPLESASRISYHYSHEKNQQSTIPDPEDEESSPQEEDIFAMDL